MIKILVDASNIKVGGGLQVAISVITELESSHSDNYSFSYLVSNKVYSQLSDSIKIKCIVNTTGIINLIPFNKVSSNLREMSRSFDCVFSIFGPAFWNPRSTHVIGFANAWIVSDKSDAYKVYSFQFKCFYKLKNFILGKLLFSNKKFYITETESVRALFIEKFRARSDRIAVVPNSLPYTYDTINPYSGKYQEKLKYYKHYFKFVSITYNYPHKNLNIIEKVGELLELKGIKAIFIVTFPKLEYDKQSFAFKKYTVNMGPVSVEDCESLYKSADALFLPTLIECFSVSYLEAMVNKICITTSHYDFAKDVCDDCAMYFDPFSPQDVANKLATLICNEDIRREMIIKGEKRINTFFNNKHKVLSYLQIINNVIGKNHV